MRVNLCEAELRIARWIGKQRYLANRNGAIVDRKIGAQDNEVTDVLGALGEFAFCKRFNLWPDLSLAPRRGGVDYIMNPHHRFASVDVKATPLEHGRLLVAQLKDRDHERPDVYVLAIVLESARAVDFKGWLEATEMHRAERLKRMREDLPPTYAAEQGELKPMEQLYLGSNEVKE